MNRRENAESRSKEKVSIYSAHGVGLAARVHRTPNGRGSYEPFGLALTLRKRNGIEEAGSGVDHAPVKPRFIVRSVRVLNLDQSIDGDVG